MRKKDHDHPITQNRERRSPRPEHHQRAGVSQELRQQSLIPHSPDPAFRIVESEIKNPKSEIPYCPSHPKSACGSSDATTMAVAVATNTPTCSGESMGLRSEFSAGGIMNRWTMIRR